VRVQLKCVHGKLDCWKHDDVFSDFIHRAVFFIVLLALSFLRGSLFINMSHLLRGVSQSPPLVPQELRKGMDDFPSDIVLEMESEEPLVSHNVEETEVDAIDTEEDLIEQEFTRTQVL